MSLSTHVLDAVAGRPADGLGVVLTGVDGTVFAATETDADGRVAELAGHLAPGHYRLTFATGAWFAARDVVTFYPEVVVAFRVTEPRGHLHVPLLLSPFAYSTYRGS